MDLADLIKGARPRSDLEPEAVKDRLAALLEPRLEIDFAYLHGSLAAGLPCRDIDVAVRLVPEAAAELDAFDYAMDLSVELTLELRFTVDVQVLNDAPLGFQHAVLQGQPVLVRDEQQLGDYIERTSMEFMEFDYLRRQYLREVLAP